MQFPTLVRRNLGEVVIQPHDLKQVRNGAIDLRDVLVRLGVVDDLIALLVVDEVEVQSSTEVGGRLQHLLLHYVRRLGEVPLVEIQQRLRDLSVLVWRMVDLLPVLLEVQLRGLKVLLPTQCHFYYGQVGQDSRVEVAVVLQLLQQCQCLLQLPRFCHHQY